MAGSLSSYGRRAFSVAGPAIWNWLPDSLRDPAISRYSFRRFYNVFTFLQGTTRRPLLAE